jgi:hypothetical protein
MTIRAGLAIGLLCACPGGGSTKDPDAAIDPRQIVLEVPVTANRNLDLLFVVDDSPSMLDKQQNLIANFPNFINVLQSTPGGLPNLHVGVVTTDMGTKASGSPTPGPSIGQVGNGGCAGFGKRGVLQTTGAPVTGNFLSDIGQTDGTRLKNYTGDLSATFGMMARVGAGGCGFEQPLAAMRAALDNNPANAGFLRVDALLGIVFLTDEDDCSLRDTAMLGPESPALGALQSFRCTRFGVTCTVGGGTSDAMNTVGVKDGCGPSVGSQLDDVTPYRDFLVGLKTDPRNIVVSGIMGTTQPFQVELRAAPGGGTPGPALAHSCVYQGSIGPEVADPPVRIRSLLDGFPSRSTFSTVCQQDLSAGLQSIGALLRGAAGSPCIAASLADTDPATAGLQVDCVVEDIVGTTVTPIAQCPGVPCWTVTSDPATCPTSPSSFKLVVSRTSAPDPATVTRMRCIVQ